MHAKYTILLLLTCLSQTVKGQFDPQFSMNTQALSYYNPASIGYADELSIMGLHRQQWVGVNGAPSSSYVATSYCFGLGGQMHAIGLHFTNDAVGLLNNMSFGLQYAFKLELGNGYLSLGLQVGGVDVTFDPTKVEVPTSDYHQSTDPGFPTSETRGMVFDMGAGIFYSNRYLFGGVSATHLMEPAIQEGEGEGYRLSRGFQFTLGGNIEFRKSRIDFQPSLFIKTDFLLTQYDANLRVIYDKKFWGGVTWRVNDAVVFMVGLNIKGFKVGYAYDLSTSSLIRAGYGTHEISLGYSFTPKYEKAVKTKYKSVRIL